MNKQMKITDLKTRKLFSQAYILGGSPCSGKSTYAERLLADFKLQYYKVDDHERDHSNRSNPSKYPVMQQSQGWVTTSDGSVWLIAETVAQNTIMVHPDCSAN